VEPLLRMGKWLPWPTQVSMTAKCRQRAWRMTFEFGARVERGNLTTLNEAFQELQCKVFTSDSATSRRVISRREDKQQKTSYTR
jgi:hypothetical protein